ncbi:hypothetical protein SRHO_G00076940 [Serrasalmus rhombeus]
MKLQRKPTSCCWVLEIINCTGRSIEVMPSHRRAVEVIDERPGLLPAGDIRSTSGAKIPHRDLKHILLKPMDSKQLALQLKLQEIHLAFPRSMLRDSSAILLCLSFKSGERSVSKRPLN